MPLSAPARNAQPDGGFTLNGLLGHWTSRRRLLRVSRLLPDGACLHLHRAYDRVRSAFPLLADFPWQVKNMFIFSPGDRGAARLASIWEVVRSLEKLFPGQSEFVRADLMVLVILNGNDYLPKVRGVSFRRCFRSYVRLKGGKHR